MEITELELRALVRDVIARGERSAAEPYGGSATGHSHASHLRFALAQGSDADGACLIEPSVRCTHCGFCQSFGH